MTDPIAPTTSLRALALVCTLTPSPGSSSSVLMAEQVLGALAEHRVTGELARADRPRTVMPRGFDRWEHGDFHST